MCWSFWVYQKLLKCLTKWNVMTPFCSNRDFPQGSLPTHLMLGLQIGVRVFFNSNACCVLIGIGLRSSNSGIRIRSGIWHEIRWKNTHNSKIYHLSLLLCYPLESYIEYAPWCIVYLVEWQLLRQNNPTVLFSQEILPQATLLIGFYVKPLYFFIFHSMYSN